MATASLIRCSRLLHFNRLVRKAPSVVIELLHLSYEVEFDQGWLSALRGDLMWLSLSDCLPVPSHDLHAIQAFARSSNAFAKLVRKFSVS